MPASLKVFTKGACRCRGAQHAFANCRPLAASTADSIGLTGIEFVNAADDLPRPESTPPAQYESSEREMM